MQIPVIVSIITDLFSLVADYGVLRSLLITLFVGLCLLSALPVIKAGIEEQIVLLCLQPLSPPALELSRGRSTSLQPSSFRAAEARCRRTRMQPSSFRGYSCRGEVQEQ